MLKWFRWRSATSSLVGPMLMPPPSSSSVPSGFIEIGGWNISPAFSSTVICERRSSTRFAIGCDGSR